MLVPGVSGGSMAMILGIYDKLITSVSSFFACKKRNALFLLLFALGGGAGMLLFANPLLYLLERYPLVLRWFFIGAVAGSTPMMLKKAQIHSVSWRLPVFLVVGFSAVALFSILPAADASRAENPGALFLICAGLVAAVALVLPGISVSSRCCLRSSYAAARSSCVFWSQTSHFCSSYLKRHPLSVRWACPQALRRSSSPPAN